MFFKTKLYFCPLDNTQVFSGMVQRKENISTSCLWARDQGKFFSMLLGFFASLYSYFDKLSRPDNHFFFNIPPCNQSSIFDHDFLLLIKELSLCQQTFKSMLPLTRLAKNISEVHMSP